jgi:hypothetical protein
MCPPIRELWSLQASLAANQGLGLALQSPVSQDTPKLTTDLALIPGTAHLERDPWPAAAGSAEPRRPRSPAAQGLGPEPEAEVGGSPEARRVRQARRAVRACAAGGAAATRQALSGEETEDEKDDTTRGGA